MEEFIETIGGADGLDGKDGENGKDGADGKNCVGIKSIEINEKGKLIVTLSNETVINLGVVKGADGKDGVDGKDGQSAFDIWKELFGDANSTEDDFLNWLKLKPKKMMMTQKNRMILSMVKVRTQRYVTNTTGLTTLNLNT